MLNGNDKECLTAFRYLAENPSNRTGSDTTKSTTHSHPSGKAPSWAGSCPSNPCSTRSSSPSGIRGISCTANAALGCLVTATFCLPGVTYSEQDAVALYELETAVDESSGLAGGHPVCIVADDAPGQRIRIRNSWGPQWGDAGHAWLSWSDLDLLFQQGGDAVQPVI